MINVHLYTVEIEPKHSSANQIHQIKERTKNLDKNIFGQTTARENL